MADQSIQDFAVLLADIDGGKLRDEMGATLREALDTLSQRALDTSSKAKGTLTLTLKVSVEKNGLVTLDGDVASKLPKPLRASDCFYLGRKGGLTRQNPKQQMLPLREAPAPVAELKEVRANNERD